MMTTDDCTVWQYDHWLKSGEINLTLTQ